MRVQSGDISLPGASLSLTWGAAWRAKVDGQESGDAFAVMVRDDRAILVAIDGAGSGAPASHASHVVIEALTSAKTSDARELVETAHDAARGTRGAALVLAVVDLFARKIHCSAVGDIEGSVYRTSQGERIGIVQRYGTIGYKLASIAVRTHDIGAGDCIRFVTDGVRQSAMRGEADWSGPIDALAARHLDVGGRGNDDALVLCARIEAAP